MGTRNLAALRAVVKNEGGFGVADEIVNGWINEVHKEAVSAAHWLTARVDLGPTTAGEPLYDLPVNVIQVESLRVGTSSPYTRVGTSDIDMVDGGDAVTVGNVYSEDFDATGNRKVRLSPAPEEDGDTIIARVALIPDDLDDPDFTSVPDDVDGRITDGAIAIGLQRIDERPDQASVFDAKLSEIVSALRQRKTSQVPGEGARIQLQGVDYPYPGPS